ncbi:MAG: M2 family metallopeptidase, partial [Sinobacteraceae bacterium]|nr:M2 family metallopeptidase [Nevskiaceae bacterium]
MKHRRLAIVSVTLLAAGPAAGAAPNARTAAEAREFVARVEQQLAEDADYLSRISWTQETYLTADTNWLLARADAQTTERAVRFANESARFDHVATDPVTARKLYLLKHWLVVAAPTRPGAA